MQTHSHQTLKKKKKREKKEKTQSNQKHKKVGKKKVHFTQRLLKSMYAFFHVIWCMSTLFHEILCYQHSKFHNKFLINVPSAFAEGGAGGGFNITGEFIV